MAEVEPIRDDQCFLGAPDPTLLFLERRMNFALAGLGPIVPGYCVASTRQHVRSAADLDSLSRSNFAQFLEYLRSNLAERFGSCVIAEHGRLPVCLRSSGLSEAHCYHAHLLLFPAAPAVDALALPYFEEHLAFGTLEEALSTVSTDESEYYLLSSVPYRYLILRRPIKAVRQFSRALVAAAVGSPNLADWQASPNYDDARKNADFLRQHFLELT